jgi:hypothetical protein
LVILGVHPGPWIGWADESSPAIQGRPAPSASVEAGRHSGLSMVQWIRGEQSGDESPTRTSEGGREVAADPRHAATD